MRTILLSTEKIPNNLQKINLINQKYILSKYCNGKPVCFQSTRLKKKKKKLRHWEFHFDNSTKNDHIILLVSESSVPLSVLKTSCARVGALKL